MDLTCTQKIKTTKQICGQLVRFSNTELCEDCWAEKQYRYHGNCQSTNTLAVSGAREPANYLIDGVTGYAFSPRTSSLY